jgi:hypothetical protein
MEGRGEIQTSQMIIKNPNKNPKPNQPITCSVGLQDGVGREAHDMG